MEWVETDYLKLRNSEDNDFYSHEHSTDSCRVHLKDGLAPRGHSKVTTTGNQYCLCQA